MNRKLFLVVFVATLVVSLMISFRWSGDGYGNGRDTTEISFGWTEDKPVSDSEEIAYACLAVPVKNLQGFPWAYKRFMAPCAPPETEYNFIALFINLVSCAFAAFVVAATVTKIKSAVLKQS
jgi:hypothetical protein